LNLKLDTRQAVALRALINIAQSDPAIDPDLKHETKTVLTLLDRERSSHIPERVEYRGKNRPFIIADNGEYRSLGDERLTPEAIRMLFTGRN